MTGSTLAVSPTSAVSPLLAVSPTLAVYLSVGAVSLIAFVGVISLVVARERLTGRLPFLVSFAAGTLFGNVFLHLLPEAAAEHGFRVGTGLAVLAGVVLAFSIEKYIAWHHHHRPHRHDVKPMAWMILLGDGVHNTLDGVIVAISYLTSFPLGVATTLAIAAHEIPQELGDFGVLLYAGIPARRALAYNFLTALTAFVGASLVLTFSDLSMRLMDVLLPLAAGNFVYIAGSDLLPELVDEPNVRRSTLQMLAFLAGIGLLYLLTL